MNSYDIWCEGYAATGNRATAECMKRGAPGKDFRDACKRALTGTSHYDAKSNTYWGCRLFDNEADARARYG
jgi:hypothetical protein